MSDTLKSELLTPTASACSPPIAAGNGRDGAISARLRAIGFVRRSGSHTALLRARRQSPAVRQFGAMLLDEHHASAVSADGPRDGIEIGTPAEKGDACPLAWGTDPFDRTLTGAFVKVLVGHRPDCEAAVREEQFAKLAALQTLVRPGR